MHRFLRLAASALVAGAALLGSTASAQGQSKPLIIGGTQVFIIRTGDVIAGRQLSVQDRINHVQDIYAKHLGGQSGKVTWKPHRNRVHFYLNGDFVLAVTPADAKLNGYKTSAQLAPVWAKGLDRGFKEANVRPTAGRP